MTDEIKVEDIEALIKLMDEEERKNPPTLLVPYDFFSEVAERLRLMEATIAEKNKALNHIAYYALDNIPEEIRAVAKAALLVEKDDE